MMTILCWVLALLLPLILFDLFTRYLLRQWDQMLTSDIPLCKEFGFPNFGSCPYDAMKIFFTRKIYIWYTLFVVSAALSTLLPAVGRVVFYLASAFLFLLLFAQYWSLSLSKAAYRSIIEPVRRSFLPIVRMFRASFAYISLLFIIFILFFDLVIFVPTDPVPSPSPTISTPRPSPTIHQLPMVYVTESGEKYHRPGCRYVTDSAEGISIEEAEYQGYTPCTVCDPHP